MTAARDDVRAGLDLVVVGPSRWRIPEQTGRSQDGVVEVGNRLKLGITEWVGQRGHHLSLARSWVESCRAQHRAEQRCAGATHTRREDGRIAG